MVTGESVTASALTELTAIAIARDRYLSECVPLGGSHELAPDGVLAGFEGFLRSSAADMKRWRRDLSEVRDKWDTHPPMAERVAALDPRSGPPDAGVRAVALIPDLACLSAELDELACGPGAK
jgi:Zn-dependent protease with chaperone function